MNGRHVIAVLAGGTLAFAWLLISWMLLPWHQSTMSIFEEEDSIGLAIKEAAPKPGIYTYPGWADDQKEMEEKMEKGPYVFAVVVPAGVGGEMASTMITGLLIQLVTAALLLILLLLIPDEGWKLRMLAACVAAFFLSVTPALNNWNWSHFPVGFTLVAIADGVIAWTLAGFVMAKIVAAKRAPAAGS